jgi:putative inorganic carbon (hco3(-)) transporter
MNSLWQKINALWQNLREKTNPLRHKINVLWQNLREKANLLWQKINALWQKMMLGDLALPQWQESSYVSSWIGALAGWRSQSWILQWGESIAALMVAGTLLVSPFVSTNFLGFLLAIGTAFWLLLTVADDGPNGFTPIHVTLLVFWGIAVVASAFAPEKVLGLKGLKMVAFTDGISKLSLYLMFFVVVARLLRSPRLRSWIVGAYLHIALLVSVYGIYQLRVGAKPLATWVDPGSPLANTTRAYSFLGNPNVLAAYLLPAIALSIGAIFLWQRPVQKVLAVVMVAMHSFCMYGTQSRGAWIATIVMLVVVQIGVFYWYRPRLSSFWQIWLVPVALLSELLLLGGSVVAIPVLQERVSSIFVGRGDSSNSFRINVWQAVQQMIRQRPLLGIGYGDRVFKKVYPIYQINPKYSALSAYSIYLETLVEMGFIGLLSFLWIMLVSLFHGIVPLKGLREMQDSHYFWLMGGVAGAIGLAVQGCFDTVWYRPDINILWWLSLGIIASFYYPKAALQLKKSEEGFSEII